VPLDILLPAWQDAPTMSAGENQFFLIRAASLTGGAAKNKFHLLPITRLAENPANILLSGHFDLIIIG
jgi:hypothetical protein